MKNKKGFTIIEVLAVILLIGIILSLAIPAINKYLISGTSKYYSSLEDTFLLAGRDYLTDYKVLLPREIGNVTVVSLEELTSNKYINDIKDDNGNSCDITETKVVVRKTGKNKFEYYSCLVCNGEYVTNDKNCSASEDENITVDTKYYKVEVDPTKASGKYTIDSDGNFVVMQGDEFTLPLGNAYYNGTLVSTEVASIPKVIDTNKLGTTLVTYAYEGAKTQIKVKVVDGVSPSIPQVVLRYNNKNGNQYTGEWYSGNIYQEFKSTDYTKENLKGSGIAYYEICTEKVCDKNNSSVWKKLTSNNRTDGNNGIYTYSVRSVDKNGNVSEANSYTFSIDKEPPTCKLIVVSGTKGNGKWYKSNIEIGWEEGYPDGTVSDVLTSTKMPVAITSPIEDKTVTAQVTDEAGNISMCDITVSVDNKKPAAPTITASDSKASGAWHNTNFTLTISQEENLSKNIYYYGETNNPTTQGNSIQVSTETSSKIYYAKVCSKAGICSDVSSYEVKLDKTKPTCEFSGENSTWTTNNVTINAKCNDDRSECTDATKTNSWTFSSGSTGAQNLSYTIIDKAGNSNTCSKTVNVYVDKTGPSTPTSGAIGNVSGSNTTGTIQTVASGSTDSGIGQITYKYLVTTTPTQPANTDSRFSTNRNFTRSCGTTYYAWAIAEDALGNRSSVKSLGSTSDGANKYSGWGTCSKKCGTGTQTRTNTCALVTTDLSQNCNTMECCSATTYTTSNGKWSTCSKNCGTGSQTYFETRTYYSAYDGSYCSKTDNVNTGKTQNCNTHSCVYTASCPSGYTLVNNQCRKQTGTNYSCPNGGTLSGSTCTITSKSTYTATAACYHGGTPQNNNSCYYGNNSSVCGTSDCNCVTNKCNCKNVCVGGNETYTYNGTCNGGRTYTASTAGGGCNDGLECQGKSNCSVSSTQGTCNNNGVCTLTCTSSWTYSCQKTGTRWNDCLTTKEECGSCTTCSQCANSCSKTDSNYLYYTCPNGGTLSGTTCNKTNTSTYNATGTPVYTYSTPTCPNGGSLSGSTCTITP